MLILKQEMMNVEIQKTNEKSGVNYFEFHGGFVRQQVIDFYKFYSAFAHSIQNLSIGIRKMLEKFHCYSGL